MCYCVDIEETNRKGSKRSGINKSVGPDPSAGPEGAHEGLGPTRVVIPTEYISHEVGLAFIISFSIQTQS